MITIRYPLIVATVLLTTSALPGQQVEVYLESGSPAPAIAHQLPYEAIGQLSGGDDWSAAPLESVSVVEIGEDHAMIESPIIESAPCPTCSCGKRACYGVCTDPGHPRKPRWDKPGDVDRGDCPPKRYRMHDCKRAGNPHCVAWWAKCSVDGKYSAWFVGGGSPFARGRCRKSSEGTWGLDYGGLFGHARVWLNYTRHDRYQGGEGAYATDGEPKIVSRAHEVLHLGH